MNDWISNLQMLVIASKQNLVISASCVAVLWIVHFCNLLTGMRLNAFGILPRTPHGLIGIFTSPFLHGNFEHLFFNSIPCFILIDLLLIYGVHYFVIVTLCIMIITGGMVWLLGRRALHIGASGVMMGFWTFLLFNAIITGSSMSWLLGMLCIYYLGGLGLNLLPQDAGTSWEAHVFGAIAGAVTVFLVPLFLIY